jgi:hypothetical protein
MFAERFVYQVLSNVMRKVVVWTKEYKSMKQKLESTNTTGAILSKVSRIEENSRKCFIVPVEDRSEKTLVALVQQWILPQTTIISDCWNGYINLQDYGYYHKTIKPFKRICKC